MELDGASPKKYSEIREVGGVSVWNREEQICSSGIALPGRSLNLCMKTDPWSFLVRGCDEAAFEEYYVDDMQPTTYVKSLAGSKQLRATMPQ